MMRAAAEALGATNADAPLPAPAVQTVLFCDIRGYTAYTRDHGDEAGAALAASFAGLVGELGPGFGGRLLELRGDEALLVFGSPRQALRFGVALQRRVAERGLERG